MVAGLVAMVLGGLLFLGWGTLNEAFRTTVDVSTEEIVANSAWVGRKVIRWDQIDEVSWSNANRWFIIRSSTETKIRVSIFIGGVGNLTSQLRRLVPDAKLTKAEAGFRIVDSLR